MEVVNTDQFEPTEHLIGQQQTTLSFGVSSDPALMAMLSTGLYTYPHRTMIQELLFNAWDAHKMNGSTDKAIDVYINSTSGLIVRDYGPGIEPGESDTNIHGTYCIYGYSSKRADKNMTGGFGLGTKAPFAYTESFSVTSFWGGTKNMYLIRRVAEDQNGRPGFTPLLKVPTEETGLMVVIPLKKGDEDKTRDHVRDVAYLSGLKINIHFEDEPEEQIRAQSVADGEFLFVDQKDAGIHNVTLGRTIVYAMYGGVRYAIPRDEAYDSELNFIHNVLKDNQRLMIGFPPNSLTPTPNRENLNLNEKTKEAIRRTLELFYERFQEIIEPLTKTYVQIAVTKISEETPDPIYGFYRCMLIGDDQETLDLDTLNEGVSNMAPNNAIDQSIWKLGLRLINKHTQHYIEQLNETHWYREIFKAYTMLYPSGIKYVTQFKNQFRKQVRISNKRLTRRMFSRSEVKSFMVKMFNHSTMVKLDGAVHSWNQKEKHPMVLRSLTNNGWATFQFHRPYHKVTDRWRDHTWKNKRGSRAHRPAQYDGLYFSESRKDRDTYRKESDEFLLPNVIIMAKTFKALEDTMILPILKSFRVFKEIESRHVYRVDRLIGNESLMSVVVHESHGAYDKAKLYLESLGYMVFEAPEPERIVRVKTTEVKIKKPEGFRLMQADPKTWVKPAGYIPTAEEVITDPEYFIYRTGADFGDFAPKRNPSNALLAEWIALHPKTVVVNNIIHSQKLHQAGVKNLEDVFHEVCSTWFTDSKRFRLLVLLEYLETAFRLPLAMLDSPSMRKEFNVPIPAKEKIADYRQDIERMRMVANSEYPALKEKAHWVKMNIAFMTPDKDFIQKKNEQFTIFELSRLGKKFHEVPPEKQEAFIKKVIKMTKSF